MKNLLTIFIIFAIPSFITCNFKQNVEDSSSNCLSDSLGDIESRILLNGDTIAYNCLLENYNRRILQIEILYFSEVMCNKYNYAPACLDCYYTRSEIKNPTILKANDSFSYKMGIYYLLRAKFLGDKTAAKETYELKLDSANLSPNSYFKGIIK